MSWYTRIFGERRALPTPFETDLFSSSLPTASGATVNYTTAMRVPEVKACVKVLSEDTGKTPLRLRRKIGADAFVDEQSHDLWELLHDLANPETDAFTFKREMTADMLLHGVAYAQIVRSHDGRVQSLWRLPPPNVRVTRDDLRRKTWTVTTGTDKQVFTFNPSMPPVLEIKFDSPIFDCRELIGTALALQTFTSRFFANGARPSGALMIDDVLSEEAAGALRRSWNAVYGGADNAHRTAILESGVTYKAFGSDNDSAQLNELLQTLRSQICGAFRVPPYKVADLTRSNYSNVSALSLDYLTGTLDPIFTAWEMAVRRDLLTTRQFNTYTAQFDRSALVQNDTAALHTSLANGRNAGFYSANDCRRALGLNPLAEGGDEYLVNSALVPIDAAPQPKETEQ